MSEIEEMKLYELIRTNNWLSVETTLLKLYPDQGKNISAYKEIYVKLQEMKPLKPNMKIVAKQHFAENAEDSDYVEVYGINTNSTKRKPTPMAIEFTPWRKWLGMTIAKSTLKEFNELEIISHCLFEMTFMGYDEKEIQKELSSLKKTSDELKNMTEEERKKGRKNTISLDDFLRKLKAE